VLEHPRVFQANVEGGWINPDNAPVEAVVQAAYDCPSGAITYQRLDGGAQEAPPLVNTARIRENGPLAFRADLRIDGRPAGIRATLCRCGASQNKPYCDGSHAGAGFAASGEPATQGSEPLASRDGPLNVTCLTNGPLEVSGNLEICTGTGRTVNRSQKTYLCRCGASRNKPYCDGTHKKLGFKDSKNS
jgi:CDGSH-type Zn-finger protein